MVKYQIFTWKKTLANTIVNEVKTDANSIKKAHDIQALRATSMKIHQSFPFQN